MIMTIIFQSGHSSSPQRLFKVVFVGDSGVGKSSFIHRFCTNNFRPSFSATIGKTIRIQIITQYLVFNVSFIIHTVVDL